MEFAAAAAGSVRLRRVNIMRILNVGDFNWMTGAERGGVNLSLFDIRQKFSLAAGRAGHLVVEFSDRAVARSAPAFSTRSARAARAGRRFLQTVDELKPDLILLHFADRIDNKALAEARTLSPGVLIADVNIDPIDTTKNQRRLAARQGVADALFVTTAEPALGAYVGPGAFAAYLPNPVDRSVESGRVFDNPAPTFDLLFSASDEGPREIGSERVGPTQAVGRLRAAVPGLLRSAAERARGLVPIAASQSASLCVRPHGPLFWLGACCVA